MEGESDLRGLKVRLFLKKNTGLKESIDEGNSGSSERNLELREANSARWEMTSSQD